MRTLPEEGNVNCLIRVLPLEGETGERDVREVLDIIRTYDFATVEIGPMATTVHGGKEEVFKMLREVHDHLETGGCPFVIDVSLSNTCGK